MLFYPISALINAVTSTIVGIIAITKGPKSRLHRSFSYFAFSVAFWSYCYFLWQIAKDPNAALFWCRALMAFAIFIPATFFHFSVTLINQREKYLNKIIFWYCITVIFLVLDFTPLFVKGVRPRLIFPFWPTAGIAYAPFLAMFIGLTTYSHVLMFKNWKSFSGAWRNQIKFVSLGTAIGFLGGTTNYPLWYDIRILPIGNILVSVYVFLVFYAIIRFRLMDINALLVRFAVFLIVYAGVLWVPFYMGYKYGLWKQATWITVLFVSIGPFLFIYLLRRAENIIFKERRRYQETINNLSENMIDIRDIEKLLPTISLTVGEAIKIKFVLIYLKQEEYKSVQLKSCYPNEAKSQFPEFISLNDPLIGILNQHKKPLLSEEVGHHDKIKLDSGVVIPLFGKRGFLGFIVLGGKQNNQMYTNDDMLVLKSFSLNTASTIENCIYWHEIEENQRRARLAEMDFFSYSIAHEIDNPMTGIKEVVLYLRDFFLKEIGLTESQKKEIESALNAIIRDQERISALINAVEEFGKPGEFGPLKLEDMLKYYFDLYLSKFKHQSILFTQEMPDKEIPYLRGSRQELMQVLVNLSNNSIHALLGVPPGEQKRIHLKVEVLDAGFIRITFKDNGYGIVKEKLSVIFAPLTTTKASTEGKGMGLNTCRKIIERHKGRIWAESEGKGKGATFIFELPVAKDITEEDFKKEDKGKRLF